MSTERHLTDMEWKQGPQAEPQISPSTETETTSPGEQSINLIFSSEHRILWITAAAHLVLI